ncbi:hypothetical protein M4D49_13050 [Cupriavidus pauculus]|uniref:DUF6966 domain-containing protein n=1 Tax=Cupriavidus pauculus TaxID=82633 RepID=UPI00203AEACF|nr:hypothetical protein [Cupriavidus pauculus]MCM3606418.1 hypothetical protein [Cupriavidus pauculus]
MRAALNNVFMGPKTQELVEVLAKLAALLESDGEQHWRAWLLRAKARLENLDYSGVEYLLHAYGGMGSFNDFIAAQSSINGQFTWKPGYVELNDEIDALRSKAWELATDIKRNHEIQRT